MLGRGLQGFLSEGWGERCRVSSLRAGKGFVSGVGGERYRDPFLRAGEGSARFPLRGGLGRELQGFLSEMSWGGGCQVISDWTTIPLLLAGGVGRGGGGGTASVELNNIFNGIGIEAQNYKMTE